MIYRILLLSLLSTSLLAQWHQASGPNTNYSVGDSGPDAFSVSLNKGVKWRIQLPETGQSTPIIVDNKVFLTCFKPVTKSTKTGRDTLAMCFDAENGKLLWQKEMPGSANSKISGAFGDNSGPSPVSDGKTVCFFNASGLINNYDLNGNLQWSADIRISRRINPFLIEDKLILTGSAELTEMKGRHMYGVDFNSGKVLWKSAGYCWNGLTIIPWKNKDGEWQGLIGRGGGHIKDEYTTGFELISLNTGKTIWKRDYEGFQNTQNITLRDNKAYIFLPGGIHALIDLKTGDFIRQDNFLKNSIITSWNGKEYQTQRQDISLDLENRSIMQMSNLLIGDYHYFRTYRKNYLGRINILTGESELIQLPTQIDRSSSQVKYCWGPTKIGQSMQPKKRQGEPLLSSHWFLKTNSMKNINGFTVVGDNRSRYSGWGHVTSAVPTVAGENLYVPSMSGAVYVLKWKSSRLDERALVSISDLGLLGESWTRSSVVFSQKQLYARTIRELICIQGCSPEELKPYK